MVDAVEGVFAVIVFVNITIRATADRFEFF